jgi:hypothetical protein
VADLVAGEQRARRSGVEWRRNRLEAERLGGVYGEHAGHLERALDVDRQDRAVGHSGPSVDSLSCTNEAGITDVVGVDAARCQELRIFFALNAVTKNAATSHVNPCRGSMGTSVVRPPMTCNLVGDGGRRPSGTGSKDLTDHVVRPAVRELGRQGRRREYGGSLFADQHEADLFTSGFPDAIVGLQPVDFGSELAIDSLQFVKLRLALHEVNVLVPPRADWQDKHGSGHGANDDQGRKASEQCELGSS